VIDRNTTALQWWLDQPNTCVCGLDLPGVIANHLRLTTGARCFERIVAMFERWVGDDARPVLAGLSTSWRRGYFVGLRDGSWSMCCVLICLVGFMFGCRDV